MVAEQLKLGVKTFMKSIRAKPEHLAFVDVLFSVKWTKPVPLRGRPIHLETMSDDQYSSVAADNPCGLLIFNGELGGKWLRIAVQTEDASMIPPDLIAKMEGLVGGAS